MNTAKIKDKILKALINKECKDTDVGLAEYLNISTHSAYALLKEMEKAGHLETVETTSYDAIISCEVRFVLPQGRHFYETTSYRREAINKWWEDVPKKYWLVTAIFGIITFALPLYLQYCNLQNQGQRQAPQTTEKQAPDTTKAHRK